jgi:hypothetical protein
MESALKGWTITALSLSIMFLTTFMLASVTSGQSPAQKTPTNTNVEQQEKTTTLSLSPSEASLKTKAGQTLTLNIDTGEDKVAALKLNISFDPKMVKVESIAPGAFFQKTNILHKEIDNKTGSVVFVFGSIEPKMGSGEVAQIKLTSLKAGDSQISLTSDTEVAATGKTYNVLKSVANSKLTIK